MYQRDQSAIARLVNVGTPGWEKRAAAVALTATMTIKTSTNCVATRTAKFRDGIWWTNEATPAVKGALYMAADNFYQGSIVTGLYHAAFNMAWAAIKIGDRARALLHIALLPGIGPAKAGFTLQMIWGVNGCIDSENAKHYNVEVPSSYEGLAPATAYAKACEYIALVDSLGGSEALWDVWCGFIAAKPRFHKSPWANNADALSAEHVTWVANVMHGLGV